MKIDDFIELMKKGIKDHEPIYGNSWKEMSLGDLEARIKQKITEYELTHNPSKLVSVANLSMLLHLRLINNGKE